MLFTATPSDIEIPHGMRLIYYSNKTRTTQQVAFAAVADDGEGRADVGRDHGDRTPPRCLRLVQRDLLVAPVSLSLRAALAHSLHSLLQCRCPLRPRRCGKPECRCSPPGSSANGNFVVCDDIVDDVSWFITL
ncbi:hypothetical protein AAHA92_06979 [Salvia divinorum]|uniref:Uncharacterized protein n=1 Tax=Salvia divinorum TaxID=28513 RepID=A0ABD1IB10_SALDI